MLASQRESKDIVKVHPVPKPFTLLLNSTRPRVSTDILTFLNLQLEHPQKKFPPLHRGICSSGRAYEQETVDMHLN